MEYIINSTKQFEKDINRIQKTEANKVISKLNVFINYLKEGKRVDHLISKVPNIILKFQFSSSLYIFRADLKIRAILSIESDPLFDQKIITLYRIVKHDELERAINSVVNSLYQSMIDNDGVDYGSN